MHALTNYNESGILIATPENDLSADRQALNANFKAVAGIFPGGQALIQAMTAAEWGTADPLLNAGVIGIETDTGLYKIGDAATLWEYLPYGGWRHADSGGGGVSEASFAHADSCGYASGGSSHADSGGTASGSNSHTDSCGTANGTSSHADSFGSATASYAHADSCGNAGGVTSHADSCGCTPQAAQSHADSGGVSCGCFSHADSCGTSCGISSHADSFGCATCNLSHADSCGTASGVTSHADSFGCASGDCSHADSTGIASGENSHADSGGTACCDTSHADSCGTASGGWSHADSCGVASNCHAHADSGGNASGCFAHADSGGLASGDYSHAHGPGSCGALFAEYAHASGHFSSNGDAQFRRLVAYGSGTAHILINGSQEISMPNVAAVWVFTGKVVATSSGGMQGWTFSGFAYTDGSDAVFVGVTFSSQAAIGGSPPAEPTHGQSGNDIFFAGGTSGANYSLSLEIQQIQND